MSHTGDTTERITATMSVYVDSANRLTADTLVELHSFAMQQLHVVRTSYHHHHQHKAQCYYPLSASQREQAIQQGACVKPRRSVKKSSLQEKERH